MRRSRPLNSSDEKDNPQSGPAGDELTYAAIISLTLPGNNVVSAQVVLSPPDLVETEHQVKPLSDCTLADIAEFAARLEADVWETYHAINLVDIAELDEAHLEVAVEDKAGRTVMLQNWRHQAVLLPRGAPESWQDYEAADAASSEDVGPEDETEAVADVAEEKIAVEGSGEAAEGAEEGPPDLESEERPIAATEPIEAEEPLTVTVSESQPVYEEREAVDDPNAYPTPAVAPSRARVRIAGKRLAPGHATWSAVDILIDEPALRSAQAHALSSPNREVAGVLIGPPPEKQPDGRYIVHIFDTIIAKYTVMHGASVTYTPESWRYMNDKLAERYPDGTAVMVGWYHTHPGFGIFLSGMDQFIHQNFFTQIWHIAMVLDPVAQSSGFFSWDRNQARVARYEFKWPRWAAGSW